MLVLQNKAGQRRLVAWTAPPPGGAPDEAEVHDVAVHIIEPLGGANDGKIHFPVKSVVFSVPLPAGGMKTGKVEYSQVVVDYGNATPASEQ